MTEPVFLDTAALVAILNKSDQYHIQAVKTLSALLEVKSRFITTTYVFAETVTRILRRVSHEKAAAAGVRLREEKSIEIVSPGTEAIDEAWRIFIKYNDQNFSFVDCVSFAVMHQYSLTRAFTFDRHFTVMGFRLA